MARRCIAAVTRPRGSDHGAGGALSGGAGAGAGAGAGDGVLDQPGYGNREQSLDSVDSFRDEEEDGNEGSAWLAKSREKTAEVLRKRKQLKRLMHMAADKFNTDKKHWVEYVQVSVCPLLCRTASFVVRGT